MRFQLSVCLSVCLSLILIQCAEGSSQSSGSRIRCCVEWQFECLNECQSTFHHPLHQPRRFSCVQAGRACVGWGSMVFPDVLASLHGHKTDRTGSKCRWILELWDETKVTQRPEEVRFLRVSFLFFSFLYSFFTRFLFFEFLLSLLFLLLFNSFLNSFSFLRFTFTFSFFFNFHSFYSVFFF